MHIKTGQIIYVSRNPLFMNPDSKLVPFTVKKATPTHFYATPKGFALKFDINTMKCLKRNRWDQAYLKESDYPRPTELQEPNYTTNSLVLNNSDDLDKLFKEEN